MDNALQALLSWQFVLFCIAVSAVTFVVRNIVDYVLQKYNIQPQDSHLWSNLILPILPVFLGTIGALIATQYPYPLEITSASGRLAFGLCAGLSAGLVWRWIKSAIGDKIASFKKDKIALPNEDEASSEESKIEEQNE